MVVVYHSSVGDARKPCAGQHAHGEGTLGRRGKVTLTRERFWCIISLLLQQTKCKASGYNISVIIRSSDPVAAFARKKSLSLVIRRGNSECYGR
jgi:hypothetical protein